MVLKNLASLPLTIKVLPFTAEKPKVRYNKSVFKTNTHFLEIQQCSRNCTLTPGFVVQYWLPVYLVYLGYSYLRYRVAIYWYNVKDRKMLDNVNRGGFL